MKAEIEAIQKEMAEFETTMENNRIKTMEYVKQGNIPEADKLTAETKKLFEKLKERTTQLAVLIANRQN